MPELTPGTERYLRIVYELGEFGDTVLRSHIARRLGVSIPTALRSVDRLAQRGLVTIADDRAVRLTGDGATRAERLVRRHRLIECFVHRIVGLDLGQVHEEAHRWQPGLSETAERRFAQILDFPGHSPFGYPIPALAELGQPERTSTGMLRLSALDRHLRPGTTTAALRIHRLGEALHDDHAALRDLGRIEALPGCTVRASQRPDGIMVHGPAGDITVPLSVTRHILVRPDLPDDAPRQRDSAA